MTFNMVMMKRGFNAFEELSIHIAAFYIDSREILRVRMRESLEEQTRYLGCRFQTRSLFKLSENIYERAQECRMQICNCFGRMISEVSRV